MDIQTKDLNWDTDKFTSGTIIYGGKDYPFEWKGSKYIINGPPPSSDFDEAKLIDALIKEFRMR